MAYLSPLHELRRAQWEDPQTQDWEFIRSTNSHGSESSHQRSLPPNLPQGPPQNGRMGQSSTHQVSPPTVRPTQPTSTRTAPRFLGSVPANSTSFANAVYYPNWSVYGQNPRPPSTLNFSCITHVFYAFLWPNPDGTFSHSEEHADLEIEVDSTQGAISSLMHQRARRPNLRVILSIGGAGRGSGAFATVAAHPQLRLVFARNLREWVELYNFDGVDIDWEHPQTDEEGADYVELLRAVRSELQYPLYIVTSALPAGSWALDKIDIEAAVSWLDYLNLMTYDFSGPWTPLSGHQSQLWSPEHPHDEHAFLSCNSAVTYLTGRNVPRRKILLGIPLYGRAFRNAQRTGQPWTRDGVTFLYHELPRAGAQEHEDADVGAVFSVGGEEGIVSYDNPRTVQLKAEYVRQEELGGLFYWNSSGDSDGHRSLVYTGFQTLSGP